MGATQGSGVLTTEGAGLSVLGDPGGWDLQDRSPGRRKAEKELWNPTPRFPQGSLPEGPESHPWGEAPGATAEKQHRPGLQGVMSEPAA